MQTVIETASYLAASKDAAMSDEERQAVVSLVAADPQVGDVMRGTGGCRKVRFAGRGKGKSGGYRIILAFGGNDIPVFLITVFGKGDKANLTRAESNELAKLTRKLFETYGSNVKEMRRAR